MDDLDIRILRTMGVVPYGSEPKGPAAFKTEHIARRLGVSGETVRTRIKIMEASGVIAGYEAYPNLQHLGLDADAFLLRVPGDEHRARLANEAVLLDWVVDAYYFIGPEVCLDVCFHGHADLERKLRILASMSGDDDPARFYSWSLPRVERSLDALDWRIVQALRGHGRRPLLEVAEALGVSYRTVKRRHDQMAREGSLFIIPLVDPGKGEGMIPFALLIYLREGAPADAKESVLRVLDSAYVHLVTPASKALGNFDVLAFAPSPQTIEETRKKVASVPGVTSVQALVTQEVSHHAEWIDDAIRAKVEAGQAPKGTSREGAVSTVPKATQPPRTPKA